ncbi:hypothetical protein YC2023_103473 [Brassica napus]
MAHANNISSPRSEEAVSFHVDLTTVNVPSTDATPDFFSWTLDGVKLQTFSSSKTWSIVRERQPICGWHKTVGFKGHIPKHALTMWVAVLDRLPTRNRLALWGMLTPISCCLCSSSDESRDHFFVECDFTKDLWRRMLANSNHILTHGDLAKYMVSFSKKSRNSLGKDIKDILL